MCADIQALFDPNWLNLKYVLNVYKITRQTLFLKFVVLAHFDEELSALLKEFILELTFVQLQC